MNQKKRPEQLRTYTFCPLVTTDGDARAGFVIDETDLEKVSDHRAIMTDQRTGRSFRVRRIKHKGEDDHVLCES
jgi:hypothetical protein